MTGSTLSHFARGAGGCLTAADHDSGEYFHYTYDAVGNRLRQETHNETNTYAYDIANRLTSVDAVAYSWDDNGNLLADGVRLSAAQQLADADPAGGRKRDGALPARLS